MHAITDGPPGIRGQESLLLVIEKSGALLATARLVFVGGDGLFVLLEVLRLMTQGCCAAGLKLLQYRFWSIRRILEGSKWLQQDHIQ